MESTVAGRAFKIVLVRVLLLGVLLCILYGVLERYMFTFVLEVKEHNDRPTGDYVLVAASAAVVIFVFRKYAFMAHDATIRSAFKKKSITVTFYYEGAPGIERKVRSEFADGTLYYYEGARGLERVVRIEVTNGTVAYYDGPFGIERRVHSKSADGTLYYYEGARGLERVVRTELTDGAILHHEGVRGLERIVRIEYTDGTVTYYDGACGTE